MRISVGQALLILMDKYKNNLEQYNELKKLYLSGAKDQNSLHLIEHYLTDEALINYEVSQDPQVINDDNSRRYFETQLAYQTLGNNIDNIDLKSITEYLESVKSIAPDYYEDLWNHVTQDYNMKGDNTEKEYADYLRKLADKEIFPDFTSEAREKIAAMVASSFIGIIIASNRDDLLPLSIYGEGIYLERGKVLKEGQGKTKTSAYGLLKGHSPLPMDDPALMKKTQEFLKPSDQASYDLDTRWVKDNFAKLVHPFSNSISGTMLCQMRALLKIRKDLQSNPEADPEALVLSAEKIKTFAKVFISAMLFNSGGHSLYEYTALFELEKVQDAFADIEGFDDFNLEELFLESNQEAFDSALNQTIEYNKRLLVFSDAHQQIKDKKEAFDTKTLVTAIEDSSFNEETKDAFLSLIDTSLDNAQTCFRVAQDLQALIVNNKTRVTSEYFSSYRSGASRHQMLEQNLSQAIVFLSQGELGQVKDLINQTKTALNNHKSSSFFQTNVPELDKLNKIYQDIDHVVETGPQMEI